jgi:hypothetical protein
MGFMMKMCVGVRKMSRLFTRSRVTIVLSLIIDRGQASSHFLVAPHGIIKLFSSPSRSPVQDLSGIRLLKPAEYPFRVYTLYWISPR